MHRFYVKPGNIWQGEVEITDPDQVHQIRKVLRLGLGDQLMVFSDNGVEYVVEIRIEQPFGLLARVVRTVWPTRSNHGVELVLCLGLLKKDKFEWVLQKGTEIGIERFVPVVTDRCVRQISEIPPRWHRIVKEAAEQCGAIKIPKIDDVVRFTKTLKGRHNDASNIDLFFHPETQEIFDPRMLGDIFEEKPRSLQIWIGPEGGFSDEEVEMAQEAGFLIRRAGELVLRAETAAMVYPAIISFYAQHC